MSEMPSREFIRRGRPHPFREGAWPSRAAIAVLVLHLVAMMVLAAHDGSQLRLDFIGP